MLGINRTHYLGSVASPPDLKYTPAGLAILELTVAGRGEVVTAAGEVKHPAFYNRCKCFGTYAESLAESLRQGDVVSAHGRLEYRAYEVEGDKRSTVETVIETIQTLAGRFVTEDDRRGQPVLIGGLNHVTLGGNLTRGAELKRLQTGSSVTRLSVAVNGRYTAKGGDGERVGYFELQAWGELAEALAEGAKGQGVVGVGRLVNESWEDKDGTKRYATKVELERAHLVSSGRAKHTATATPEPSAPGGQRDAAFPPEETLPF